MFDNQSCAADAALAAQRAIDSRAPVDTYRKELLTLSMKSSGATVTGGLEGIMTGGTSYGTLGREIVSTGKIAGFDGANAEERAYRFGMFFKSKAANPEAARWCSERGLVETRTQTEGNFGAGGALIPLELSDAILRNVEQYGIARQWARVFPMNSAALSVPRGQGDVTVSAVDEETATPASDNAYGGVNLTAKEFSGLTRVSNSLLEDSPVGLASDLVQRFGQALAKVEDQCLFTADGSGTYAGMQGLLTKLESGSYAGSVYNATSTHKTFATFTIDDLTNLIAKAPEYAKNSAAWFCSAGFRDGVILRLVAAAGGNTTQTLTQGVGQTFLGPYRIVTSPVLPSGASTDYSNKIVCMFGSLSSAVVFGDRRGMSVRMDGSRYLEYRQTAILVSERFDCVTHDVGSSTVAGPVVGLRGTT
jgi:HK97 family phage major capsid protein